MIFCAMYAWLPYKRQDFFSQLPGAVATSFAWSVFSYGFSVYIEYSKGMSAIYGSLTTVVMVMLWLYFCMWLLFMGAEINCYLEQPESFQKMRSKRVVILKIDVIMILIGNAKGFESAK